MMQTFPFSPRIKLKHLYGSSFYQFQQLKLFLCTLTLVFKYFLYTTMSYISNAKTGCNFITPSFQHTQLQHFCPEIPQQRARYSTSYTYASVHTLPDLKEQVILVFFLRKTLLRLTEFLDNIINIYNPN